MLDWMYKSSTICVRLLEVYSLLKSLRSALSQFVEARSFRQSIRDFSMFIV